MDIAAIQQDTPAKIDFNAELRTVAVSNVASALTGCGFTGSYIFRSGDGAVIAACLAICCWLSTPLRLLL